MSTSQNDISPTKQSVRIPDRRQKIIDAGLAVLREEGLSAFTQPRVATRAELRQSHLTYYFPTRLDLILAVAEEAMTAQLASLEVAFAGADVKTAAENIARTMMRPERTRVIFAVAQLADFEPAVRETFIRFSGQIAKRLSAFLKQLGATSDIESTIFIHTLTIGVAVSILAQKPKDSDALAAVIIEKGLRSLLEK